MAENSPKSYPAFTGSELCALKAHQIVALLKKKEISPKDLLQASQARTETVEPMINATPVTCWNRAYEACQELSLGETDHPAWLGGLPLGIKDLNAVEGVRTTWGNPALANFVPSESDPLVKRIEARGGLVVGKTNTPEFGAGGNTFNAVFGATLNPWNTKLNAGGSSGGAAAALATGETWLSHGSDHGGSLRTPAAYCGIVGLRPSPGRVIGGGKDLSFMREAVQGPMARSVTDCALFLDVMSGFDAASPLSYPAPEVSFLEAVKQSSSKPRIAFSADLNGFAAVDGDVKAHLACVMQNLKTSGAVIEEAAPDTQGLEETYHTLRGILWAAAAKTLPAGVRETFKPTLEENTSFGERLNINDVCQTQLQRSRLFDSMRTLFESFDVLACPVVGCMPRPQTEEWVTEIGGQKLTGYMDWLRFAFLATTLGLPALSVPVGLGPRGLPVGLQLIGKPRGEGRLLQIAKFVEDCCGGPLAPIDPQVA